jgi:elongator complex protein 3
VLEELARRGQQCRCIRCREVRGERVEPSALRLVDEVYHPASAEEHFLQFVTPDDRIAGYLRLSLPAPTAPDLTAPLPDLHGAALVREVHVYGQSLAVGAEQSGAAQHIGLGTRLLAEAARIAAEHGFSRLAVIAAVGTRLYYESRGFQRGQSYMVRPLG